LLVTAMAVSKKVTPHLPTAMAIYAQPSGDAPAGGIPSWDEGAHSARISKRDYTAFCLIFTSVSWVR
jgi:hypothetical protein